MAALRDPRYRERHKFPKRNGTATVLQEPRLMARVFPELSRPDHERLAREFAVQAGLVAAKYSKAIDKAIRKYGDTSRLISGAYSDHFPESVKDELRHLAHEKEELRDASIAHYTASGKRTPWRNTPLAALSGLA